MSLEKTFPECQTSRRYPGRPVDKRPTLAASSRSIVEWLGGGILWRSILLKQQGGVMLVLVSRAPGSRDPPYRKESLGLLG